MLERGFPRNNPNFHFFLYNIRHLKKLCEKPNFGAVAIVREFHANLHDRIGSNINVPKVYISSTINRFFEFQDEDSESWRFRIERIDVEVSKGSNRSMVSLEYKLQGEIKKN